MRNGATASAAGGSGGPAGLAGRLDLEVEAFRRWLLAAAQAAADAGREAASWALARAGERRRAADAGAGARRLRPPVRTRTGSAPAAGTGTWLAGGPITASSVTVWTCHLWRPPDA